MKIISSSRITSLATSDSFGATPEQSSQNINQFEEQNFNSTELHHGSNSDNDPALPSDVLKDFSKPSSVEETFVESRTQSAEIESVIERNEWSKETVNENIDRSGIAEAILLDSISTNSGING